MQKVLVMTSDGESLRSRPIANLDVQDGDCAVNLTEMEPRAWVDMSTIPPIYPTIAHVLGDGWKLIAPPKQVGEYPQDIKVYEWWFVKD